MTRRFQPDSNNGAQWIDRDGALLHATRMAMKSIYQTRREDGGLVTLEVLQVRVTEDELDYATPGPAWVILDGEDAARYVRYVDRMSMRATDRFLADMRRQVCARWLGYVTMMECERRAHLQSIMALYPLCVIDLDTGRELVDRYGVAAK